MSKAQIMVLYSIHFENSCFRPKMNVTNASTDVNVKKKADTKIRLYIARFFLNFLTIVLTLVPHLQISFTKYI